jgi:peroxiredoxin
MKRVHYFFIISILFLGCKEEIRTDYTINGNAKDVYNGIRIFLNDADSRGKIIPIDTAIVMNESFTFEGKVATPRLLFLTANSINGRLPIFVENSEITINLNKDNFMKSSITGSESHNLFSAYLEDAKKLQTDLMALNNVYRKAELKKDTLQIEEMARELQTKRDKMTALPFEFMKNNPESFVSLYLFQAVLKMKDVDLEQLSATYNRFSPELKSTQKATEAETELNKLKMEYEANKNLQIGGNAPAFSGPNPNGEIISLYEVVDKAKVTVIDFWAAWCGPCRKENPNVVRIYNKYHDQGLEIIGVSLDGQSRQKDPRAKWLEAIEQDKLTWNQISNLKYFNDPIAQLYNIRAIPATYILDESGKIVAKNLRGPALELKIKELIEN